MRGTWSLWPGLGTFLWYGHNVLCSFGCYPSKEFYNCVPLSFSLDYKLLKMSIIQHSVLVVSFILVFFRSHSIWLMVGTS